MKIVTVALAEEAPADVAVLVGIAAAPVASHTLAEVPRLVELMAVSPACRAPTFNVVPGTIPGTGMTISTGVLKSNFRPLTPKLTVPAELLFEPNWVWVSVAAATVKALVSKGMPLASVIINPLGNTTVIVLPFTVPVRDAVVVTST